MSPKITTEICKQEIVKYCQDPANMEKIIAQFHQPSPQEVADIQKAVMNSKNWKRTSKEKYNPPPSSPMPSDRPMSEAEKMTREYFMKLTAFIRGRIPAGVNCIRSFNCDPLDDQLRAYVYSDDTTVYMIEVVGE